VSYITQLGRRAKMHSCVRQLRWCAAELHRKVVELQMCRAMLVVQHPAIAMSSGTAANAITSLIAQAMISGLDELAEHEYGKAIFTDEIAIDKLQQDLEQLTLADFELELPRDAGDLLAQSSHTLLPSLQSQSYTDGAHCACFLPPTAAVFMLSCYELVHSYLQFAAVQGRIPCAA
jgi:hypothetical protein